ncbi:methyl-accepting chemotaxis protein [Phenylobacterium sp. LjRoot225]|uniref:methyl-accepting chemotaxis protein n=1 Tax=Phenylobacterium sp. LjRoot225 TaxID=3342285 RepID=UPI003ECDBBD9
MLQEWTFSRRISASLALGAAFAILVGLISVVALRSVVTTNERLIRVNVEDLLDAKQLSLLLERKSSAGRGYLLNADARFVEQVGAARREFAAVAGKMGRSESSPEKTRLVAAITQAEAANHQAFERVAAQRRTGASIGQVIDAFDSEVAPTKDETAARIQALVARNETVLAEAKRAAADRAAFAIAAVAITVAAGALFATVLGFVLARALNRQIGTAVAHVQSSSAELQTAANQQATGAREQATAMSEISTTISELMATSRQIAESAQRVAQIAEQTTAAAGAGEGTVDQAHDSIAGIRQQMDMVVSHMLELGRKSQQIGAVVDIVSELAEQTNILAINATIEAAGAGEAGARFAVVADEIRQLADRVGGSTKEIRPLVDEVRSAVNTTIMATETGSKAVDAGSRQFGEVASSFKRISGLLGPTSEAAREIELSTKQQSTAVEQVNIAIGSVAQTTRETEVSAGQTLDTVSQLAGLSRDLLRLVKSGAPA